jgi:hypothetical protein
VARLKNAGVKVEPEEAMLTGSVRYFAEDPFGNRLELLQTA